MVDQPGDAPRAETLEVNKPLNIDGTTVHLIGHGYAPIVTVKDGDGNVAFSGPVVMLPQDGNFTSIGAIKVPDARPERLAFEAFFYPSGTIDSTSADRRSVFPDALNPMLFFNAWSGPPKVETGEPENVYSLDPTGLTQLRDAGGQPLRYALNVGDGVEPARRQGLDPVRRLDPVGQAAGRRRPRGADLDRRHRGGRGRSLSVAVHPAAAALGLTVTTSEDGSRVVEIGGLDRTDGRGDLGEDVDELVAELGESVTVPRREVSRT